MDDNKDARDEASQDAKNTVVEQTSGGEASDSLDSTINSNATLDPTEKARFVPKKKFSQHVQDFLARFNIYFLLFLLVLIMVAFAAFASYNSAKKEENASIIGGQELTQEDIDNLNSSSQQIGDAQQTLTIASNAVFNGRVLVRNDLDVAGTIRVGGALSLPGITVSGTSAFENVQIASNLSIAGNAAIQGTLTVQQNLSVGGSASFAGQISAPSLSVDRLILNQDIQINRHIDAGGATPRISRGGGVGGAGTVSVSGTDTAGTITANFNNGPGGDIATVSFTNSFQQTPHIVATPIGSTCSNVITYISTRTTGGFTIAINGSISSGSCSFDYIAID